MSRLLVMYVDCDATTLGAGVCSRSKSGARRHSRHQCGCVEVFAQEPVAAAILCESIDPNQRNNIAREMRMLKPLVPYRADQWQECNRLRIAIRSRREAC